MAALRHGYHFMLTGSEKSRNDLNDSIICRFADHARLFMLSINRNCSVCTRISLVLVYLSFFLVQFNIHLSGPSGVSFFSSGYNSEFSHTVQRTIPNKIAHKDKSSSGIKLNKRFHPQHFFITPEPLNDLTRCCFPIQVMPFEADQPLTQYAYNSPSLRGPPPVV